MSAGLLPAHTMHGQPGRLPATEQRSATKKAPQEIFRTLSGKSADKT